MLPARTQSAGLVLAVLLVFPIGARADEGVDPWLGEALYYAHQGLWFEALERLDSEIAQYHRIDEPELDSLHPLIGHAEFSVGDFELEYRMHHAAGRAIRAVLEADVPDPVRNEAAYRLARLHFEKGQPALALAPLDGMRGEMDSSVRDDAAFLRSNVLIALGRPSEATAVLRDLQSVEALNGLAQYNLAVALLEEGRLDDALAQLGRAGRIAASRPAELAMRDKSNLVLGALQFENEDFAAAKMSLDRVRLSGAFSNQALLRMGWADASAGEYRRALVPWQLLAQRERTDVAVQEAWLALPYAYGELDVHGRAATLYGEAVASLAGELSNIEASIDHIRGGRFLEALAREEIRRDADWVIRLRRLPEAPETFYLIDLIAQHSFQTALQDYLDLEDLHRKLEKWTRSLAAYESLVVERRAYYTPLLPDIDARFRALDARRRMRLEQRALVEARLRRLLVARQPELLATADEQAALARLDALQARLEARDDDGAVAERIARLRGVIAWRLETGFADRLSAAHRHLSELDAEIARLEERHSEFVRVRQAAVHSYEGFEPKIAALRPRVLEAERRVDVLRKAQGHNLEKVAIAELVARRDLLENYQNRARFAFADSYDRAAKARADTIVERETSAVQPPAGIE